jgi:hypothetical protein
MCSLVSRIFVFCYVLVSFKWRGETSRYFTTLTSYPVEVLYSEPASPFVGTPTKLRLYEELNVALVGRASSSRESVCRVFPQSQHTKI